MKPRIRCIIVDDEPLSQEILADYTANCPELELQGIYGNPYDARERIMEGATDLLLLDINMPGLSGINLMKSLPHPPLVIFITAYAEYAVEGFNLQAVDYLLKPVSFERFQKAIARATEKLAGERNSDTAGNILVKADKKIFPIDPADILFIEAQGDYIQIHLASRHLMVYASLSSFEQKLPTDRFFRIHKSYLVSLAHIEYIEGNQVRIHQRMLPVSPRVREELVKRLSD